MLMTINLKQGTLVEISSRKRYGNKLKFNPVLGWLVRRSSFHAAILCTTV